MSFAFFSRRAAARPGVEFFALSARKTSIQSVRSAFNSCVAALGLAGLVAASVLLGVQPASATLILDTTGPNIGNGYFVRPSQSVAVPFFSGPNTQITSITIYLEPFTATPVDLGIMADASGVPSGSFLDFVPLTVTSDPMSLTPNWSIQPNQNYWLAADAGTGFLGLWEINLSSAGPYAFTQGSWVGSFGNLPAAVIEGSAPASVPEPSTLALFGAGLLSLGVLRRRRRAKA